MRSLLANIGAAVTGRRVIRLADPADIAFVAGCVLIAVGAGIVAVPAGLVVGGALLAWTGWRAGS